MTTKPKRKAPGAKPKAATKQASGEPKRTISEICRLVTRWRFLEAEEAYQAVIAGADKESEELICEHDDEQYGIEIKLSKLISQDFTEARELLGFAIDMREGGFRTDGTDQMMLRNILESLFSISGNDAQAARLEGAEKMRGQVVLILENVSRNMDNFKWP